MDISVYFIFRFEWNATKFEPDFSISPTDGYISAGMDVQFDVAFHPKEVNSYIKYDVSRHLVYRKTIYKFKIHIPL